MAVRAVAVMEAVVMVVEDLVEVAKVVVVNVCTWTRIWNEHGRHTSSARQQAHGSCKTSRPGLDYM